MPELLHNMIIDILVRLPVKSLLRFRSVSKPLCSEIDSPDFTKLHLNHSKSHRNIILSRVPCCKLYSLNAHSLDQARVIDNPMTSGESKNTVEVIGSCNGLICLLNNQDEIMVWNPSTRKHINVPSSPTTTRNWGLIPSPYSDRCYSVYGFCYDSLHDDYKLLSFTQFLADSNADAFVWSAKSDLWKPISIFPFCFPGIRKAGMFVSGALHFLVNRTPAFDVTRDSRLIIAIDVTDEEYLYRDVAPPPESLEAPACNLGVLNDCLSLSCLYRGGFVGVWVMKDYGVMESWSKVFSIPHNCTCLPFFLPFKPLATYWHGCDYLQQVILQTDSDRLLLHDLKSEIVIRLDVLGGPKSFQADVYVDSLVNPIYA